MLSLLPGLSLPARATDEHNHTGFTEWTSADSLPTEAGSYYLTQDVTISSTWSVPEGTTNLCLNGHGIMYTGSGNNRVITMDRGVGHNITLNLYDCDTATEHYITLEDGRGTSVSDTGTESDTCIKVTGGYITDGNNQNARSGGVYVETHSNTSYVFNMYGGTIVGNKAYLGVYDTFNMSGGSVTGNTASEQGGGVLVNIYDWPPFGGTFNLSGSPTIAGNKKGDDDSNVYLGDGVINGASEHKYLKINVTGALADTARVGVTMQTPGVFTDGLSGKGTAANFTSDDAVYSVAADGAVLKLVQAPVAYMDWDETTKTVKAAETPCADYTPVTAGTTGMNDGWYVVSGSVEIADRVTVEGEVHLILMDGATLTASKGVTVAAGNSLTVYGQGGGTGKLIADAGSVSNAAGIGGSSSSAGTIIINGGSVEATGERSGIRGNITINDGDVKATASGEEEEKGVLPAGISGVKPSETSVNAITINGGRVEAFASYSIGILSVGGVTITGGKVTAIGGSYYGIGVRNSPLSITGGGFGDKVTC